MISKLLEVRNKLKAKKPTFIRHDAHKKKRISKSWRRPKGRHNKMRLHKKGYARGRSTGFGSPTAVKGLSRQGLQQNVIVMLRDFENLDPKTDGIIIARTIGDRKKMALVDYAQKNNFTLLTTDVDVFKKKIEEKLAQKASKQKEISKRKEEKTKVAKTKSEKEKKSKEVSEEDKKAQEKKDKDKVLIKRDQGVQ